MYEIKIGAVIKRMLWKLRKNLKEISREAGIPYSTLHTWHCNRKPKDIIKAQQLADYFKISLHELIFDRTDIHENIARNRENTQEIPRSVSDEFFKGRFEIIIKRLE